MPKRPAMTQEDFNRLLAWFHPDREQAGIKYEEIRQSLIRLFTWRGCLDAEGLADEAFNRVVVRRREPDWVYKGDPANYFYGVAKKLFLECHNQSKLRVPLQDSLAPAVPPPEFVDDPSEQEHECLSRCIGELDPDSRQLIMDYYALANGDKIEGRKALAARRGITVNNLRVRVYRIRALLERCVKACLP